MVNPDPERLYERLHADDWAGALAVVRGASAAWATSGPVAARACELLVERLRDSLRTGAGPGADELELVVLLGRSGRLPVSRETETPVIEHLLSLLQGDPARALAIARFRPDLPTSAAVIAQFGIPGRSVERRGPIGVTTAELRHGTVDAGRSVFRSEGERALHEAATVTWPDLLVLPNVALHAALDYERLRARLTTTERRFFFTALVDCVAFDPRAEFRPVHFVELDSPVHDDARRAERDGMKDRIVALAGFCLARLRPSGPIADRETWESALRAIGADRAGSAPGASGEAAPRILAR